MRQAGLRRAKATVLAAVVSVALSGCTIPFTSIELPDLPSVDLSELDLPPLQLPVGVDTSVGEARAAVLSGKASTLDDSALVVPGYLTVGVKTAASTAPLCVEGEAGRLYGLDVDLGAALASEMGLKVRYVPVVDASSLGADCDVIANGRSSDPNSIAIAGTYVESATSFFYRGEPTVLVPTDLGGKSVGLQGGSVSEAALNNTGLKMSQKSYATLIEAFKALAAGEVDFVLCEAYPGAYLASLHEGLAFAGSLETPETAGIVLQASNAELLEQVKAAFETISSNGILELCRTRWVGSMPTLTAESKIEGIPARSGGATEAAADTNGGEIEAGSNAVTSI